MEYKPKTGVNAGKRNFKEIQLYLKKHPTATGVQIANALGLTAVTVYKHLRKIPAYSTICQQKFQK